MSKITILWADDEIDLLRPHILFLNNKGYDVVTVTNGRDALDAIEGQHFDLHILDENMPGISGLEALQRIKIAQPTVPVIMITKSEEENIMNQAIGSEIADYLIKPVNPMQILLSIKKNLHSTELVSEKVAVDYRQEFMNISGQIGTAQTIEDWYKLYSTLVRWELTLSANDTGMADMLRMQKDEANAAFCKFVRRNYESWVTTDDHPLRSNDVFKSRVLPLLDKGEKVFFVVIDNFRLDQWKTISPLLADYYNITQEELYTTILPTATQYARNAIFSGLMPIDIERMFPDLWVDEDSEEGKNVNEAPLIQTLLDRYRRKLHFSYNKVNDVASGEKLLQGFNALKSFDLNVIVINFVDMMSHARTELCHRNLQAHGPHGLQGGGHHRPRHHPRRQSRQGHRRQEHQRQLALQVGQELELQPQARLRDTQAPALRPALPQCEHSLRVRAQPRLSGLSQQLQPLRVLLQRHLPARRHLDGRDACALGHAQPQVGLGVFG